MISTSIITLALSVLSLSFGGSASPLTRRDNCLPNFEGTAVSVINSNVEWAVTSTTPGPGTVITNEAATTNVGEFHFAFNGAPTNTYNIRSLQVPQFPELVVSSADPGGLLTLQPEDLSSPSDPLQSFIVLCNTCNTGASGFTGQYATGCTISPAGQPDQCYQTDNVVGDAPALNTCNGAASQLFDFWTVA